MENILEINKVKQLPMKEMEIDPMLDIDLEKNRESFQKIVGNVIDKGADYVIKAMPINESVKDILVDVKKAFKTKDFKEIVKTAVNSSIREGLELLSIPKNVIADITKIKDVALKGGLGQALSVGIDIVTKKYMNGNIFTNFIAKFIKNMKDFVLSKAFSMKIDQGINKVLNKSKKYIDLCDKWYEAYEKFDIESINTIAKSLNHKKREVLTDHDCVTQNNIIQNMTRLINSKKDKLSQMQLQICSEM